ncbi:putative curved DNA-binding protein [[Candida] railenensis]|uniref:Curved DNA-binding protein n=1 Tax=[Candida] railenensis TaxID=45579 RepID=A0A9P0QTX9_9ASCO|nr:putative curved DNA-binding protein [[Candida] railenensis]
MSTTTKAPAVDYTIANSDVIAKYKTAGEIAGRVIEQVKALCIENAQSFDICQKGDELMTEELSKIYNSKKTSKIPKGIAFPTTISPNHIPAHLSPVNAEDEANLKLAKGDVVKVMLGIQIDGFPSIIAETVVIGASKESPVSGKTADLVVGTWKASEAAIRTFTTKHRNWDVTNIVEKVANQYGCTPLESMLTHNQERNVLYGPKEIILNPSKENKTQVDTFKFEENEVYGMDILVSTSAEGKVKESSYKTSLYKITGNSYALKMKSSHQVLGEFKEKCGGPFPYNIKNLEDARKARMGLIECCNHQVMLDYKVMTEKEGEFIAQYFTTFAITKNGIVKFTSPSFDVDLYKTDKVLDEDTSKLLEQPLKVQKKKKAKKLDN